MSKVNMLGVIFNNIAASGPIVDSNSSTFFLPFYKDEEYFSIYENYIKFVKECEKLIRKHSFYKKYKAVLIDVYGMKTCQVLSNISADEAPSESVTIEMHHGPILTLFDTCCIVLNSLLHRHDPGITTHRVANIVIEEHRLNHIRVVLLSKTVHQMVTENDIKLNYNMGFGDTAEFLKTYGDGLDESLIRKINSYIKWSQENDSVDNDVLKLSETMKEWGCNDYEELENLQLSNELSDSVDISFI